MYNHPISYEVVIDLKRKYMHEYTKKGNTWTKMSIHELQIKLREEYQEVEKEFNYEPNLKTLEELKDLMLVTGMLYRKLTEIGLTEK